MPYIHVVSPPCPNRTRRLSVGSMPSPGLRHAPRAVPEKPLTNTRTPIDRHLFPLLFVGNSHPIGLDRASNSLRDQREYLAVTRHTSISKRLLSFQSSVL